MSSSYPLAFDDDRTLFVAQDDLQVPLGRDYQPGDGAVWADTDITAFPPSGIITLVDQCSDPKDRKVSLHYTSRTNEVFLGITPTDDTITSYKSRKTTVITLQLRAEHHNSIVDAIISIESFLGTHKSNDPNTLLGRVNLLQALVHSPKSWFEVDKTVGLAPLTVTFTSKSTGITGPVGEVVHEWNFGNGMTLFTSEPYTEYTYSDPGIYDVTLKVSNAYGEDVITLHRLVNVRLGAPEEAVIAFDPQVGQLLTPDTPEYGVKPKLRTPVNQLVLLNIPSGNSNGVSYAGELLDSATGRPVDPITQYTWNLGDDLPHGNATTAKAAYSIGGLHDLILRVDTAYGAYRITTYEDCIDVVEIRNMWLWTLNDNSIRSHEFGFTCETFKTRQTNGIVINRNDSFLDNVPNGAKQKHEFRRNCGFAPRTSVPSGLHGTNLLYWASGRQASMPITTEEICFTEYCGFTDVYTSVASSINRPWNWVSLVAEENLYFILGTSVRTPPGMSPTNPNKTTVHLGSMTVTDQALHGYNYINGAQEVAHNPAYFDTDGKPIYGNFSTYRTTWRGNVGYILRNDDAGDHFALRDFYKTDGILSNPFLSLVKLVDAPGSRKEGQLASMVDGVFLFNNSDIAVRYNESTGTWETTGGASPGLFRSLQDTSVVGYDNELNTLLVVTDGNYKAFLSYDYSNHAFLKFNGADLTFSLVGTRPYGEQWLTGVY